MFRSSVDTSVRGRDLVACRVCGRTLLIGERSLDYYTVAGDGPFDVCELCVPRAGRYGLRPYQVDTDPQSHAPRRLLFRRRVRGSRVRSAVAATSPAPHTPSTGDPAVPGTAAVAVEQAAKAAGAGRRLRRKAVAAAVSDPAAALTAVPVGEACIPMALAAFNQSPHARTLAGLSRTLGTPRTSVAPRTATDREIIVTVAWEIVWYQFRVMPGGIEQQRGQYLSELDARWQHWNARVTPDGTVHHVAATSTGEEHIR